MNKLSMKLRALLVAAVVMVATAASPYAQVYGTQYITAQDAGSCATAAACASFAMQSPSVNLQVAGTFSATLTIETTADGVNWTSTMAVNLADGSSTTSITSAGQYSVNNSGISGIRLRAGTYASGTIRVTANKGGASARWLAPYFVNVNLPSAGCVGWNGDTFIQRTAAAGIGVSATCGGANTGKLTAGTATLSGRLTIANGSANAIYAPNSAAVAKHVIGINGSDQVLISGDGAVASFGGGIIAPSIAAIGANTGQLLLLKSDGTFTTDGSTLTWDSSADLLTVNGLAVYANGVRGGGTTDVSFGSSNSGQNVFIKGTTGAVSINTGGYTYANRPSVSNGYGYAVITDSNTDTWGATVAGGGSFKILAFYNGTNWTVAAK